MKRPMIRPLLPALLAAALLAPTARADYTYAYQIGTFGSGPGQLNTPNGVAVDGAGNVFVADSLNNRIAVFSPNAVPEPSSPVLLGLGTTLLAGASARRRRRI